MSLPAFSSLARAVPRVVSARSADEFLSAVRSGQLERVQRMLAENADLVRATDGIGRSAYVLAFLHGHEHVAATLKAAGLELDIVEAVLADDWQRVQTLAREDPLLLERAHPIGGTPLYAGALVGSSDLWRLRGLGCNPEARPAGGTGFTPARGALESAHTTWAYIALTDLCANGSDVNAPQRGGSSVLHGAVLRRNEGLVRLAIRKGADVDAVDDEGRTPRALAAEIEWKAGVSLLEGQASLPRDNRSSRFALDANREPIVRPDLSLVPQATQNAVTGNSHANLAKVREFVASNQRLIFSVSADDELAIEASAHVGSRDIIRYHLDHGAPLSLPTAVSLGDFDAVEFWLQRDPLLVHERGAHDYPVMWYAVLGGGSVEMAELLVDYGVPLDQESAGATLLHWCVRRRDADLAHWLLERGANPEPVGYLWQRDGQTPLQVATQDGNAVMAAMIKAAIS